MSVPSSELLVRTKLWARQFNIDPVKQRGQHFLVDEQVVAAMVAAAQLRPGDQVMEIGPGFGTLTQALLASGARVTAIELDRRFKNILSRLADHHNFMVQWGDGLSYDPAALMDSSRPYKIVASLPYNISAKFFRHFLWQPYPPSLITVLVQAEVAERICAAAGQMSLLSLAVQLKGAPRIIKYVEAGSFWPAPQVRSAILQIVVNRQLVADSAAAKMLWQLARIGFSSRRKQLKNNLAAGYHLPVSTASDWLIKAGLAAQCRAQDLTMAQWLGLMKIITPPPVNG